jgi:hypothetical protein
VLDAFFAVATEEDAELVFSALPKIAEGTWLTELSWVNDFNRKLQYVVALRPGLVLIFRLFYEFPTAFVIVRIGDVFPAREP